MRECQGVINHSVGGPSHPFGMTEMAIEGPPNERRTGRSLAKPVL